MTATTLSPSASVDLSAPVFVSKKSLWAGYLMSALPVLLMLFSAGMKFMQPPAVQEGFKSLGISMDLTFKLGVLQTICAIVYVVPRTAVLGAILLTGYIGGAIATTLRVGENFLPIVIFGVFVWGGLYLRDPRIRQLLPFRAKA